MRQPTWKRLAPLVAMLGLLLFTGPMAGHADAKGAGWRERLKKGVARARTVTRKAVDRTKASTHRAEESWTRAAPKIREKAHAFREKARAATSRSSEAFQRGREKATQYGGATREKYRDFREKTVPRMKDWGRHSREKLSSTMKRLDPKKAAAAMAVIRDNFAEHGPLIKARIAGLYADGRERLLPRLKELAHRYGDEVRDHIRDPELRAKTMDGLAAVLDIQDRIHTLKDHAIAQTLDVLGNQIKITIGGRTGSCNELAGPYIAEKFPFLEGTSFTEEPVQALTSVFVLGQPDHLLHAIPIVASRGGNSSSISEVLTTTSSSDVDNLLATMDVASNVLTLRSSLRSGSGVPTAALGLTVSLRGYAKR